MRRDGFRPQSNEQPTVGVNPVDVLDALNHERRFGTFDLNDAEAEICSAFYGSLAAERAVNR